MSDPGYRSLRAGFFFGISNWQEQEDIIKTRLSIINSPKEYFKESNHSALKTDQSQKISIHSVCVVYFFAMNNMYLDDFCKAFNINNPALDIWREFTNLFDCFEEAYWKKTTPLPEIIHEGAFDYIKHYLDINLVDIKNYGPLEGSQLFLTFTDKKLTFKNLDKVPNGKFFLHIKPEDIQRYDENKEYQFSFSATVRHITNLSLIIRAKDDKSFILNAHHKNSPLLKLNVGDEVTIGILNSTLYDEEGETVEFVLQ